VNKMSEKKDIKKKALDAIETGIIVTATGLGAMAGDEISRAVLNALKGKKQPQKKKTEETEK